jgi:AcrR family transcriptional regulator
VSSNATSSRPVGIHFQGDLRQALIDAAAAALADVGPEDLSLRALARSIGVSHAAPAHHFGDKAGLLTAVATEGFELFTEHLVQALSDVAPEPLHSFPKLGRAYAEFAQLHPGHFAVMFRPALTRGEDDAYAKASEAAFGVLQRHVEACQQSGWRAGADTRILANAAWALAHGITVLRSQGSLARQLPDTSLEGIEALTTALIGREPD